MHDRRRNNRIGIRMSINDDNTSQISSAVRQIKDFNFTKRISSFLSNRPENVMEIMKVSIFAPEMSIFVEKIGNLRIILENHFPKMKNPRNKIEPKNNWKRFVQIPRSPVMIYFIKQKELQKTIFEQIQVIKPDIVVLSIELSESKTKFKRKGQHFSLFSYKSSTSEKEIKIYQITGNLSASVNEILFEFTKMSDKSIIPCDITGSDKKTLSAQALATLIELTDSKTLINSGYNICPILVYHTMSLSSFHEQTFDEFKQIAIYMKEFVSNYEFENYVIFNYQMADASMVNGQKWESVTKIKTPVSRDAVRPENVKKNRYNNIRPGDSHRVKLDPQYAGSDYINASYIYDWANTEKPKYIAAQGPLPETVDTFWSMIHQKKIPIIIRLTQNVERGRQKCAPYEPEKDQIRRLAPDANGNVLTVKMIAQQIHEIAEIHVYSISSHGGREEHKVVRFHFMGWNDHDVPRVTNVTRFRDIVHGGQELKLKEAQEIIDELKQEEYITLVHCSAGVGRTGSYIIIDEAIDLLEKGERDLNIHQMVQNMRMRRPLMVQTH
ncbi:MAG: hypothetical protein MHPSP_000098, partial [Paramarteilia canceri]